MPRTLHWFRNDLRLHDNPALYAASLEANGQLVTCHVATPQQWQIHDESPGKLDLLQRQLDRLQAALTAKGIPLYLLTGSDFASQHDIILRLMRHASCERLFFNEEHGINERRRDRTLGASLRSQGLMVRCFRDQAILPVGSILTREARPYTVFTPFKRRWLEALSATPTDPLPVPASQAPPDIDPPAWGNPTPAPAPHGASVTTTESAGHRQTLPSSPWPAGEEQALQRLETFACEIVGDYERHRNFPAVDGTSRLSPYLGLGMLSGRQCFTAAQDALQHQPHARQGIECWINELIWRDFYIHILHHFPRVSMHRAFKPETDALPWRGDGPALQAWSDGRTGIPIVDAAMRQLRHCGWMHNRLRMICAMFLTKNLFVDWRLGERFFMRHLVDGYLPANNGGWQWSASTGTDAAPYFRIFNPVAQSEKFDPHGVFLRHYLPELAGRDDRSIHQPLQRALVGVDYPLPIVDLATSRREAIAIFAASGGRSAHRTGSLFDEPEGTEFTSERIEDQ